jgi:hypothetical protein
MISMHVPDSFYLLGMVVGVAVVPLLVIGTLFLVIRAALGV